MQVGVLFDRNIQVALEHVLPLLSEADLNDDNTPLCLELLDRDAVNKLWINVYLGVLSLVTPTVNPLIRWLVTLLCTYHPMPTPARRPRFFQR